MGIGNIIVGQSGGPTSVINSSVAGVIQSARELGANKIYGMLNGAEGLLAGRYTDLTDRVKSAEESDLLKRTPASFLGTCRYKLGKDGSFEQDCINIFGTLKRLDIKSFFYVGGNDSMDSVDKMSKYARSINSDIRVIGVPKTIDNDLLVTDHTPGYGSAAKYVAATVKEIILDAYAYSQKTVVIIEIMGRDAGWLTAASLLAKDENSPGPDMIMVPEDLFEEEKFLCRVNELLGMKDTVVIAVSEGLHYGRGKDEYVSNLLKIERIVRENKTGQDEESESDPFGHKNLTGTALYLKQLLIDKLKLKRVRSIEFAAIQRCAAHFSSLTDVNEAYQAGYYAAKAAANGETGKMVTFERTGGSGEPYSIKISSCNASEVANRVKYFPNHMIDKDKLFIKDEFLDYARPLIMGELHPIMSGGLPRHFVL